MAEDLYLYREKKMSCNRITLLYFLLISACYFADFYNWRWWGTDKFYEHSGEIDVTWCKFWFAFRLLTFCFDLLSLIEETKERRSCWKIEVLAKSIYLTFKTAQKRSMIFLRHFYLKVIFIQLLVWIY